MTKNWSFAKVTDNFAKQLSSVIVSQNYYLNKIQDVYTLQKKEEEKIKIEIVQSEMLKVLKVRLVKVKLLKVILLNERGVEYEIVEINQLTWSSV